MGIITKEVEVKVNSSTIGYYKSLGYEIPMKKASESTYKRYKKEFVYDYSKSIIVKIEDLQKQSNVKVEVLCDYCKEEIVNISYDVYNRELKYVDKIACVKCKGKKQVECCILKYGTRTVSQLDWVKDKVKETWLNNLGVEHPMHSPQIQEKVKQTIQKKYGCDNIFQNEEIQEKYRQSMMKKYGVEHPMFSKEIQEKMRKTLYDNKNVPTSKQQLYIYELYNTSLNAELNYPISYYSADICFPIEKLDIEIDFGGHNLSVKMGQLTQEEFNQKEIIRNNIIKREGYKQMRIISKKDFLPPDDILLQMLEETRQYFIQYPEHSWIEYDIDTSIVRNAENKQGVLYDYGKLRKIN